MQTLFIAAVIAAVSFSIYTCGMLILILISVYYSLNVIFSTGKDWNDRNQSTSDSHYQIHNPRRPTPLVKIPLPLNAI